MIQVAESGVCQLKGAEANVIKCLIVKDDALVSILDQLMHGKSGIVSLKDDIGHLW